MLAKRRSGCPVLALLGRGFCYTRVRAQGTETFPASPRSALHHLQLLSPAAEAWRRTLPSRLRASAGARTQAVPDLRSRICGHARARASVAQRARRRIVVSRSAITEAGSLAQAGPAPRPTILAGALLRLQ